MDYCYNYGFLRDFMKEHGLKKQDVLKALQTSDYTSLNRWLKGEVPLHVNALLRFCNYYNVPLGSFFFDHDGMPADIAPTMPVPDAQTAPAGAPKSAVRVTDPHVAERHPGTRAQEAAVAAGEAARARQLALRDAVLLQKDSLEYEPGGAEGDVVSEPIVLSVTEAGREADGRDALRLRLAHVEELRAMERAHCRREDEIRARHDGERARLLAIIEIQQQEIARLTGRQN